MAAIPVVDFSPLALTNEDISYDSCDIRGVAENIKDAFSTLGFMYLKNTGITDQEVNEVQTLFASFFNLPDDIKKLYQREKFEDKSYGWIPLLMERLDVAKTADLKESFQITPQSKLEWFPEEHVPGIRRDIQVFWKKCQTLGERLLRLLTLALKVDDEEFFVKCHHAELGQVISNPGAMRFLQYPEISTDMEEGQLRCGEHTDWGTLTLLFQDQAGGLQVFTQDSKWLDVTPIEGTVLVNIGDMLQRWSSNLFPSTIHRVCNSTNAPRKSVAFFVDPDTDTLVKPLHSDKYDPVVYGQYEQLKIDETIHLY